MFLIVCLLSQIILYILKMQNIAEQQNLPINRIPKTQPIKSLNKVMSNRYLNQNIYNMFLQKRYDQCINLIERCKPDQFKLYIRSLIEKNRYKLQKSMDLLNQCLVMNKLNYSYLKCIAKNYYLLGKYKPSLAAAKDAYKINSSDYQIFYILGKISLAFGDKNTALTNFKSSVAKEPNEQSYLQQAKIHLSNFQFLQAEELLKQAINISSENPQLYQLLGLCFSKMGKNQQAFQNYKKTIEVDANKYNALIGLGTLNLQRQEVQQALQIFKKAYKISSNSAVLWNNIGIAMFKKKKLVAAYCCFKRALFLDPFRWDIHSNIALIFINKGKFLAAQIHLRSAIKLNKDSVLFNLLGICLAELKDYTNAEKCFEQAQKHQMNNEQYRFNLLMCYHKKGDKDKCQSLYQQMSRKCNTASIREKLIALKGTIEYLI